MDQSLAVQFIVVVNQVVEVFQPLCNNAVFKSGPTTTFFRPTLPGPLIYLSFDGFCLLVCFCFVLLFDRVSYIPSDSLTHFVAVNSLELLIVLPPFLSAGFLLRLQVYAYHNTWSVQCWRLHAELLEGEASTLPNKLHPQPSGICRVWEIYGAQGFWEPQFPHCRMWPGWESGSNCCSIELANTY